MDSGVKIGSKTATYLPSPCETILGALHTRLSALLATALRGDVLPGPVPSVGLLILFRKRQNNFIQEGSADNSEGITAVARATAMYTGAPENHSSRAWSPLTAGGTCRAKAPGRCYGPRPHWYPPPP